MRCALEFRRKVRRLFNRCRADNDSRSWELYREAQWSSRKEVRKTSKETWRTFCSSIKDINNSTRLHRALSRDPNIRLGSTVAHCGGRTQSEGETLNLLLASHLLFSVVLEAVPAAACRAKRLDWRVAVRIISYRKWGGRLILLPYNLQIWMGNSRLCCSRDGRISSLTWSGSFVPAWRLVTFQLFGAGRNSCSGSRDFSPFILTSSLLKTLDSLVDKYLRDEGMAFKPLVPNQHAYQAGKSVEMALNQLVLRVEKALDQQEIALGVFLGMEGAYNNTSYDFMCVALARHGVEYTIARRIRATWRIGWSRRPLRGPPGLSQCTGTVHREVFFHPSYGALSTNY